jgi:hypothetical protein
MRITFFRRSKLTTERGAGEFTLPGVRGPKVFTRYAKSLRDAPRRRESNDGKHRIRSHFIRSKVFWGFMEKLLVNGYPLIGKAKNDLIFISAATRSARLLNTPPRSWSLPTGHVAHPSRAVHSTAVDSCF